VEECQNTSTITMQVTTDDKNGYPVSGGKLGHPVPGEYKYKDLALQVEEVSDETVKYGYRSCVTQTIELFHRKLQIHHLVREGALHNEESNWRVRHQDGFAG
jgi:hypothetical protein